MSEDKTMAEKGYPDMTKTEYYLRCTMDSISAEKEKLSHQVKALSAIRKGLETSLTEAFAEITRLKSLLTEYSRFAELNKEK